MSVQWTDQITLKWANATQGRAGNAVKQTTATACDLADNITNTPFGVLLNEPKQNEMATIQLIASSAIVKGIAGETLAIGDVVSVRGSTIAAGKFAKVTVKATFVAAYNFAWGVVVSPGVVNELIQIMGMPMVVSINEAN